MVPNQLLAVSQTFKLTGPGIVVNDKLDATLKFETLAGNLIGIITIIAVLFFIIQIIFAGYAFISSQGDQKVMESTRKRLTEAVLGLVIVIIALGLGNLIAYLLGLSGVLDIAGIFSRLNLF